MKEGKLSSALVKHFHLNESVGKVLWHSLDEYGRIGEYDMKFGDTVVRGLLPEEITPIIEQDHPSAGHSAKRDDK